MKTHSTQDFEEGPASMYVYLTSGEIRAVPAVASLQVQAKMVVLDRSPELSEEFEREDVLFASRQLISPPVFF